MRWPKLETKMLEEAVMSTEKSFTGLIPDMVKGAFKGGSSMSCGYVDPKSPGSVIAFSLDKGDVADGKNGCQSTPGGKDEAGQQAKNYYKNEAGSIFTCFGDIPVTCDGKVGKDPGDKHDTDEGLNRTAPVAGSADSAMASLKDTCGALGTDATAGAYKTKDAKGVL